MKYLKKHKLIIIFLETLFIIGIIFGIILGFRQTNDFKSNIILSMQDIKNTLLNNHINNIISHLLILLFILLSNIFIPLFFLNFIYIFYKGISFGFLIYIFSMSLGIKGFLISILYFLSTNIVYLFILCLILIKGSILSRNIISYFIKKDNDTKFYIQKCFLVIGVFSLIILINDITLYFLSNNIINKIFFI